MKATPTIDEIGMPYGPKPYSVDVKFHVKSSQGKILRGTLQVKLDDSVSGPNGTIHFDRIDALVESAVANQISAFV